jgi:hypothetical protein
MKQQQQQQQQSHFIVSILTTAIFSNCFFGNVLSNPLMIILKFCMFENTKTVHKLFESN